MNLLSIAESFAPDDHAAVELDSGRCLHTLDRYSTCSDCHDICPVGAIEPGQPLALNAEACVACLACLPVCPLGAFTATDAVPALLNCAARLATQAIELICEAYPDGHLGLPGSEGAIRVQGCLAGVGVSAHLALLALGADRVVARTDACADCRWSTLQVHIETQVERAQELLQASEESDSKAYAASADGEELHEQPVWHADNAPLSRRDLLLLASRQSRLRTAHVLAKGDSNENSLVSRERMRLLAAMEQLVDPEHETSQFSLKGLGFAQVSISESCTACGACARACPTNALSFAHEAMHFRLTFSPRICIGCDFCLHVCAPGAIDIEHAPKFEQVFGETGSSLLQEGKLVQCKRCKTPIAAKPGVSLCPPCDFRRQNPFGSRMPPGMPARDERSV